MRSFAYLTCYLFFQLIFSASNAQGMKGQVIDLEDKTPVAGVSIYNIHQNTSVVTDTEGRFTITAIEDQLLEFSKAGYKVYKVRVPKGQLPPFFKIGLTRLPDSSNKVPLTAAERYKEDSLNYYRLYKHELDFEKFGTLDMIQHPFSAMSKYNRRIWAFQEEFNWFQQEKYINYIYNEKLVTDLTGLTGDSIATYMQMFRPTYNQLRSMSEYVLYDYIKNTVEIYRRRGVRARMSPSRVTH